MGDQSPVRLCSDCTPHVGGIEQGQDVLLLHILEMAWRPAACSCQVTLPLNSVLKVKSGVGG